MSDDQRNPTVMSPADVEVVERTSPFQGYFRIDKYRLRHRQFAGGAGPEIEREIFERGHAAACLPYDPDLDLVVLVEQFRPGAYAALASPWFEDWESPWVTEVVAGIIEDGEDPEDVARRETVEEAGCHVTDLERIGRYLVSPGASSETTIAYCGRVDASNVGGIHGLPGEGEDIRVLTMTPDEMYRAVDEGRIYTSITLIPIYWFRLNHARLREKWKR